MNNQHARATHAAALTSLVVLILLCLAWELQLAPLRPGGSWMVLKVLPLLLPLRGVLRRDVYTLQWSSMLMLVYLAEGLVRATSDASSTSMLLGWAEVALASIYFTCALLYLHPFKKAAREIARQAIRKASQ